jgi:peptidoglycan/xylan/chitin deacetylase (PgdA/CDA1 family)
MKDITNYIKKIYTAEPHLLLRVLTYHRIDEPANAPDLDPRQISATPAVFEQQMTYLKSHFQPISITRLMAFYQHGTPLPKRALLVTFDDACVDFAINAYPILKKLQIPAVVFIPTAFPDQPQRYFWWDAIYRAIMLSNVETIPDTPIGPLKLTDPNQKTAQLKLLQQFIKTLPHKEMVKTVEQIVNQTGAPQQSRKSVLDWAELKQISAEGLVKFGGHTRTHPILTQISAEEIHSEIAGSYKELFSNIPEAVPVFAYPNGNYSPLVLSEMKRAGYQIAFTTEDGINNLAEENPLTLKRINITRRTTAKTFPLRLQRWFSVIDLWRHSK